MGHMVPIRMTECVSRAMQKMKNSKRWRHNPTIGLDALYVGFGVRVRSELAANLDACHDDEGYLVVDQKQQTTVPGIYAAGDVVQSLSQISVCFGQAAITASAINVALSEEGVTPSPP